MQELYKVIFLFVSFNLAAEWLINDKFTIIPFEYINSNILKKMIIINNKSKLGTKKLFGWWNMNNNFEIFHEILYIYYYLVP